MTLVPLTPLLLVHAFASVFMAGLIWTIQIVHYPLFARVGPAEFIAYERAHIARITPVVGPAMFTELAAAVLILLQPAAALPRWMTITGVAMLALIWLSTALVQGPLHTRLTCGYDARLIRLLVTTNWLRTILWTLRGVLALLMIREAAP